VIIALKSANARLQARAVSLAIDLHEAGALDERVRKAAIEAILSLTDQFFLRPELRKMDAVAPVKQSLYSFGRSRDEAEISVSRIWQSGTRLLGPSEREGLRGQLWTVLTGPAPVVRYFTGPELLEPSALLGLRTFVRRAAAKYLAALCSPEELAEVRSDLNHGLRMGTSVDQEKLLPILYAMFRSDGEALDEVLAKLWSPFGGVRRCALLCLIDDTPSESRPRVREAVRLWARKRRSHRALGLILTGGRSRHERRRPSLDEDEKLALQWLLEDSLPETQGPVDVFLADPAPTNWEIDEAFNADRTALAGIFRQKGLGALTAANLGGEGVRLLGACSPYLTPDERERALDLIKGKCISPQNDEALSDALVATRQFGLSLWPDETFRQTLCRTLDHKRWAIADLAAEILASRQGRG
jgi:hypothetical protein